MVFLKAYEDTGREQGVYLACERHSQGSEAVSLLWNYAVFTACGNKTQNSEPVVYDKQPVVEQSAPDTTSSVQEEAPVAG